MKDLPKRPFLSIIRNRNQSIRTNPMRSLRDQIADLRPPVVTTVTVDRARPVVQFRMPGQLLDQLPFTLPEYRSLGFADVSYEPDGPSILLEKNAEAHDVPQIMEFVKSNIRALMGDRLTAMDSDEKPTAWRIMSRTPIQSSRGPRTLEIGAAEKSFERLEQLTHVMKEIWAKTGMPSDDGSRSSPDETY